MSVITEHIQPALDAKKIPAALVAAFLLQTADRAERVLESICLFVFAAFGRVFKCWDLLMKRFVAFAASLSVWFGSAAGASAANPTQTCSLRQYASLPLMAMPEHMFAVPVTIAGVERRFALTMTAHTAIAKSLADELNLSVARLPEGMVVSYFGQPTNLQTHLPEMQVGAARGKDLGVIVMSLKQNIPDVSGVLGVDVLGKFDAELDFERKQLNLFSQDHCPGKVVYWSDAYAVVPLDDEAAGYPTVKMQLDGKELAVALVPQESPATMTFTLAHKLYGLDEQSPGVTALSGAEGGQPTFYRYRFKALEIGGLAIRNPEILLSGSSRDRNCNAGGTYHAVPVGRTVPGYPIDSPLLWFCYGGSDVTLGIDELSKLHLYFAFGEKKLYVTAADAGHEPRKISP